MKKPKIESYDYNAKNLVKFWTRQEQAMKDNSLAYVNNLIDAIFDAGTQDLYSIINTLHRMVPEIQYGTAKRLVWLKFGDRISNTYPFATLDAVKH